MVLANGSMSSTQNGEDDIRKAMVEADVVDCMIALPGQLFYSTQIPACLWFLARNKKRGDNAADRHGHILFIDARKLGTLVDRTRREFSDEEISKIANTYHAWRGETDAGPYVDVPGFCKSASIEDVRAHNHLLTPGRYVGAPEQGEDGISFSDRFTELKAQLIGQLAESDRLTKQVQAGIAKLSAD